MTLIFARESVFKESAVDWALAVIQETTLINRTKANFLRFVFFK
jgi:hypothetical protein